jgi:N-acetylneuraminate synthase
MTFRVGSRTVGREEPAFIVAEACDNHLGNMRVAREMALQAKLAGADAVKYQHHLPDEEMLRDAPMSDNFREPLYDFLKKYALTLDQHAELMAYCRSIGITYMCTPFSYKAACELAGAGDIEVFKIGSGELTDIPSLVKIAALGKPMILSTGMCTLEEIDETVAALRRAGATFALMNCVSEYPPVYDDINLGVIRVLMDRYPDLTIGHSDHTPDLYTCYAAVALGARIVEKHIILDKLQPGPDQSVSIDMHDLHALVDGIRKVERACGRAKRVHEREAPIRRWATRSVVAIRPITAGQVIAEDMVWTKRPGTGIPSKRLHEVIGRTAACDIPADTLVRWEQLK